MTKVFIDGGSGTTGLKLRERLIRRDDVELITLSEEKRKDVLARKEAINSSDVTFLCLPDDAASEAVTLVENKSTVVIDASTAHRTEKGWAYGFPELSPEFEKNIRESKRISVPGCHASGFIALVFPLIERGMISRNEELCAFSLTGYSGGGKKMIKEYGDVDRPDFFDSPRQYALGQTHKHLKEMTAIPGLTVSPVFCPIVADFYAGMEVTVPLFASRVKGGADAIRKVYKEKYVSDLVFYAENADEDGFMASNAYSGRDCMEISVKGNDERILLVARYDNLGKGASGAAIECFNIVAGSGPSKGLVI